MTYVCLGQRNSGSVSGGACLTLWLGQVIEPRWRRTGGLSCAQLARLAPGSSGRWRTSRRWRPSGSPGCSTRLRRSSWTAWNRHRPPRTSPEPGSWTPRRWGTPSRCGWTCRRSSAHTQGRRRPGGQAGRARQGLLRRDLARPRRLRGPPVPVEQRRREPGGGDRRRPRRLRYVVTPRHHLRCRSRPGDDPALRRRHRGGGRRGMGAGRRHHPPQPGAPYPRPQPRRPA